MSILPSFKQFSTADPTVELSKIQEVALNNYIPHPVCVSSVLLTSLKIDMGT